MHSKIHRTIAIRHLLIDNKRCIGIIHQQDPTLEAITHSLQDYAWSSKYKMAYTPNTKQHLDAIFNRFKGVAWVNTTHFFKNTPKPVTAVPFILATYTTNHAKTVGRICPEAYLNKLELKNYALNTAKTYISCFEKFINYFPDIAIDALDERAIREYLLYLLRTNKSNSYINQSINAIKFYYEIVLGMPHRFYHIERPRKEKKLPKVLSKGQIKTMIDSTGNLKHRCIIASLYSAGLRRSELIKLTLHDINSERNLISIKGAKGNTERHTLLSQALLHQLRNYYKEWKPSVYLFEGVNGQPYSETSVATVVRKAAKRAGIMTRVTPHMLRHSFATHLLEDGIELRYIQQLLGHKSTKTTEIYTHVASDHLKKIVNPLDSLYLQ